MYQPLGARALIKPLPPVAETTGGLIIPEIHRERSRMGTVVAVGPGHRHPKGHIVPMEVKVGDTILGDIQNGTELREDGVTYRILERAMIHGIVPPDDADDGVLADDDPQPPADGAHKVRELCAA